MNDMMQTGFDYATLPVDAALNARAAAERIKLRLKRTVEDIIEIGRELTAVKNDLPHGQFLPWISTEFEMSEDTAQNFLRVYERFGQKPNNSVFNFKPTILYALAAPSTPDAIQICTAVQIYSNSVYQCRSRTALRQGTRSRAAIKAALLTRDTVGSPASRQYPRPTLNTALVTIHDFTTNLE